MGSQHRFRGYLSRGSSTHFLCPVQSAHGRNVSKRRYNDAYLGLRRLLAPECVRPHIAVGGGGRRIWIIGPYGRCTSFLSDNCDAGVRRHGRDMCHARISDLRSSCTLLAKCTAANLLRVSVQYSMGAASIVELSYGTRKTAHKRVEVILVPIRRGLTCCGLRRAAAGSHLPESERFAQRQVHGRAS